MVCSVTLLSKRFFRTETIQSINSQIKWLASEQTNKKVFPNRLIKSVVMEYCCHVWAGAPICYLELLDKP